MGWNRRACYHEIHRGAAGGAVPPAPPRPAAARSVPDRERVELAGWLLVDDF